MSGVKETVNGLPEPWTVRYSKSKKREYFFQPESKKSQWDLPEGTDEKQLREYLKEHPVSVRCLHILIKHRDSRRPASHRKDKITLSKEEAIEELKVIEGRLNHGGEETKSGEGEGEKHDPTRPPRDKDSFESIAHERSDCSSYKRGGDLGWFGRGEMQPSFEQAAFSLPIGGISTITETDSGVHLIKRVG